MATAPLLAAALCLGAATTGGTEPTAASAERLFEDRLDPTVLDRSIDALATVATLSPADADTRLLLAQAEAFWADLHAQAPIAALDRHLSSGIAAAGEALSLLSPRYGRNARRGESLLAALAEVEPSGAEALYWLAADQHRLAAAHGLPWLLLEEPELRRLFRRVIELAPATWFGGAYRHLAELDLALPTGFGPGLTTAGQELDAAGRLGPGLLTNHLVRAERWAVKAQDYRTFLRELDVVDGPPPIETPEVWPENELCRRRARELRAAADDLFTRAARAAVASAPPNPQIGR